MPEFVSVELFKVKKCSKTSKGFEFLKLTAKPKVVEKVKRSCKKSWEVMEFEELYRVRTLNVCYFLYLHTPPSSTKTETWFQES